MSEALKKKLEARIRKAREVIATKEGTIRRAELDLEDLKNAESRLQKQREKRISKSSAPRKVPEVKTAPKAKLDDEKIEIPTVEMELSGAAGSAGSAPASLANPPKKEGLLGGFFK